ncbi:hypothetical protein [Psychroserpens luteus]|uniref:YD repeat-containing protein n=1 Tax=Psychroserpens luteus TaxID=1434066 RepID=A0ABW5ZUW5_9FLAO|nr:hypothetical protein [Psychroserpens luteus]
MNRTVLIFMILGMLQHFQLHSQSEPERYVDKSPGDEIFMSPDVQAFQTYNFLPIDLYTGKVNTTIPLFEIKSGGITVPISINYNSGGIRISDVASNVGTSWSLSAGGNISRVVKDLNDNDVKVNAWQVVDGDGGGYTEYDLSTAGYHRRQAPIKKRAFSSGTIVYYNPPFTASAALNEPGKVDAYPDIYRINAPGLNGKFFLEDTVGENDQILYENRQYSPVFLDNASLSMSNTSRSNITLYPIGFTGDEDGNPSQSLTSVWGVSPAYLEKDVLDFNSFQIKNANGINYSFNNKDVFENFFIPVLDIWNPFGSHYNIDISSWHLNTINDPSTNKNVVFDYEEYSRDFPEEVVNLMNSNNNPYYGTSDYIHLDYSNTSSLHANSVLTKWSNLNRLSSITWDQGVVEFEYNLNRIDLSGEQALSKIVIKDNNGTIIKSIDFLFGYFLSEQSCDHQECKRLKLKGVNINDKLGNSIQGYNFEYYEENMLPSRKSIQKDFLGFYNGNGANYELNMSFSAGPSPILYYYPNQGRNSVLPFLRQNSSSHRIINGDYSLEPNSLSLTGLLKKIDYPTGGSSEFEYENHTFKFLGSEYTAGGARILKQKLSDGINERILEYSYVEDDNTSSGYINNIPNFAYPNVSSISTSVPESTWEKYFTIYDKSSSGLELTSGSFVGYSKVVQREIGNGRTEYKFHSPDDFPNIESTITSLGTGTSFLAYNSKFTSDYFTDYEIKRSKPLLEEIFSESGIKLIKKEFDYSYDLFLEYILNHNKSIKTSIGSGPPRLVEFSSKLNIERNLKSQITTTEYLGSGTIVTEEFFEYDNTYPFLKRRKTNDGVNEFSTEISYPFDSDVSSLPYMSNLIQENRLAEPVKRSSKKDGLIIGVNIINYSQFNNNLILPQSTSYTKTGSSTPEEGTIIDLVDNNGNVIQYHNKSNVYTSIIWGYNDVLPIAKIENASYSELQTYEFYLKSLSNNDYDNCNQANCNEQQLRQVLQNLRNSLPNALVTTYTYDPLIGATSMTDSKGYTIYYEYDDFNRLKQIRDQEGNILSKNDYNYRIQNED